MDMRRMPKFHKLAQFVLKKTLLNGHSKIDKTKIWMTNGSLMKVEIIAEYFWPALSYNWSCKPIFGLFESGCFTQVLLYLMTMDMQQIL